MTKLGLSLRIGDLSQRSLVVRLFLTCWMLYVAHFSTNVVREIYPALSFGDHLSFDVSEYVGLHPDIFEMPNGEAYINSNPGASMLGAIPYAVARPVIDFAVAKVQQKRAVLDVERRTYETTFPNRQRFFRQAFERGLDIKFGLAAAVMQVFLMAPLSALSAVVMFLLLRCLKASRRAALLLALLYAFATPVFFRTAYLNHNLLLGHLAFFAFVLIWRPWDAEGRPKVLHYFLAGLMIGWTVVLDYSGIVAVLVLSGYTLYRWVRLPVSRRTWLDPAAFVAGGVLAGAVLMAYQWASFGHPIYPAQHYMPATTYSGSGYNGMAWPSLHLLWETAFSIRYGLFTSAPILLLALYPPAWTDRRMRLVGPAETRCILFFTAAFFLFCAANQFSYMQFNTGVRYIVPVVPFLFLIVAGMLMKLPRTAAILIGAVGTYWSWCLSMYREVEAGLGIFEAVKNVTLDGFRLPWLTTIELMGYVPEGVLVLPILLALALCVGLVWAVRLSTVRQPHLA